MHWLKIIFTFYMLALACLPCADVEDGMDNSQIIITKTHRNTKNTQPETCSPFCICNCCGQRLSNPQSFAIIDFTTTYINKKQSAFQSFSLQNVMNNIWQPPRLS